MEKFSLSSENIMTAVEKLCDFLCANGTERKDAMRMQFAAEEVLLTFRDRLGDGSEAEMYLEKRMGTPRIVFRIAGTSCDPFGGMSDEDRLLHNLMENMGTAPVWNYRHSYNEVVFTAGKKKKLSSLAKVLIAVALGIGLGLLVRMLPGEVSGDICDKWMAPIQNAVMGFLSCLSALFVLLSVTSGICGMGDISTFNRVGRKMILRLLIGLFITTSLASVAFPIFFPLSGSAAGQADLSVLWKMIVDIIPTNIIEMFSTGNTLQIVFLAMFSSVILLIMGPKTQQLVDIITQLAGLLQQLIQSVIALMPVVVFVSMFRLSAEGDFAQLVSVYKYPLVVFIAFAVFMTVRLVMMSVRYRVPIRLLIKKLLPVAVIALSTASSAAALAENINTCENRLGIDRKVINIGIPLGQTIFMPSVAMTLIIGCLCFGEVFNVPISLPSYIILVFSACIIAVATPPMPGATMAAFTLLLTQMKIPADAMSFIIALDAITDRIGTCMYVVGLELELVDIAESIGMLDKEKLHGNT